MAKKLILDCENKLWNEVLKYKIDKGLKNNNEAVKKLIEKGLKSKSMIFYLLNYLDMQNLISREIKTIVTNNIPKKEMLISLKVNEEIITDEFNKRTLNLT